MLIHQLLSIPPIINLDLQNHIYESKFTAKYDISNTLIFGYNYNVKNCSLAKIIGGYINRCIVWIMTCVQYPYFVQILKGIQHYIFSIEMKYWYIITVKWFLVVCNNRFSFHLNWKTEALHDKTINLLMLLTAMFIFLFTFYAIYHV